MNSLLRPALSLILSMTLLTGAAYPLLVWGVGQLAFSTQANGSLVRDAQGEVRGSALLAQAFTDERWFHSRPSAADYGTLASGASNLAPSNPALGTRVLAQADQQFDAQQGPVPLALLTTSASGLDPHLPPAAVNYQVPRVARERGLAESALRALVQAHTEAPLVGPAVVNVLALNQALDRLPSQSR
ncbi:potassium-transporting ATPase subunit KdpC [Pseudomonas baltica]|uniref:Potassium-transporting ATPase KdpC subunit n=1 Tax=Pseudomonas baltica TaxID=2762576 RepID=A0A7X1G776_9PSED|nr:potassium-transporting ATPase subunit KdpC [Pseudomonas baltica]MBC2678969.1 potassium-transporting ATPase subunit KdpC [Pseudomonas baltica]